MGAPARMVPLASPTPTRSVAVALLSTDEWADRDEDDPGELVDGVIEEEEVPNHAHEDLVVFLITLLNVFVSPRGGRVYGSETKLAITDRRGRKPDVTVYLPGTKRPKAADSVSRATPDIVIEVISTRPRDVRRDRVEKRRDYATAGVRYYWLVDPAARTVEILERGTRGRWSAALAEGTGRIPVPGVRGLTLDLDALWASMDDD